MNLHQATRWRSLSGKVCTVIVALFFVAVMDGLIAILRHPVNLLLLLPGGSEEISGLLREEVKDFSLLQVQGGSDRVRLVFLESRKGFWLGGDMWRGKVSVDVGAEPGDYPLIVREAGGAPGKPLSVHVVRVLPDADALRKQSKSMLLKYGNVSPWFAVMVLLPLILLGFLTNYLLAHRREQLLARTGQGEIYHIVRVDEGQQVIFGMGSKHGLQPGMTVTIVDAAQVPVFTGEVEKVLEKDAMITVPLDCPVRTGYLVRVGGLFLESAGAESVVP